MTQKRGFALLSPEQRAAVSRLGGSSVPNDKRSFSRDHELARAAGSKGGAMGGRGRKRAS